MPDSQKRFKDMDSAVRRLKRSNKAHRIVACVAVGAVALMVLDRAAMQRDYRDSLTAFKTAIQQSKVALNEQRQTSRDFELERDDRQEKLDKARSYVGGLRYKVGKLEEQLQQCNATNSMISDEGWTGNAYIRPEGE
ncbi:MAG: hypothetical protein U9Q35_01015 [Pseudomonadota bacterium]|nr:hypothetical protein [Pseudomonadota bacterium]